MKKVVARPFLGKEKYRDYKLCYVDDIPETLSELTEESKHGENLRTIVKQKNASRKR